MQDGSNTEKLSTASGRQLKTKFQVQFSYNFHTNKQTVHLGHDLRSRLCFIENENINLPFRVHIMSFYKDVLYLTDLLILCDTERGIYLLLIVSCFGASYKAGKFLLGS